MYSRNIAYRDKCYMNKQVLRILEIYKRSLITAKQWPLILRVIMCSKGFVSSFVEHDVRLNIYSQGQSTGTLKLKCKKKKKKKKKKKNLKVVFGSIPVTISKQAAVIPRIQTIYKLQGTFFQRLVHFSLTCLSLRRPQTLGRELERFPWHRWEVVEWNDILPRGTARKI